MTTPDLQTTTYTWSNGLLTKIVDNVGLVTTFLYDGTRPLETTIDSLGNRTTNAYDTVGNLTSMTPPIGSATAYTYDGMRRVLTQSATGLASGPTCTTTRARSRPRPTTSARQLRVRQRRAALGQLDNLGTASVPMANPSKIPDRIQIGLG